MTYNMVLNSIKVSDFVERTKSGINIVYGKLGSF